MSMVLPFYISVEKEDEKIYNIIERTFSALENIGNVKIPRSYVGAGSWRNGEFGSISWYVKETYNSTRRQVDFTKFWNLLENEPWQKESRHHELIILESDLYAPETNFVFGGTSKKILNDGRILNDAYANGEPYITGIVLSVNRIKKWCGRDWEIAFFGSLLHEEGHFYGLASSSSLNFLSVGDPRMKNELDNGHCNDAKCIMEQVNVQGRMDLGDKVRFVTRENPQWFCNYDLNALKENLRKLY